MSRYVHVAAPAMHSLDEIARALTTLELPFERPRGQVMLEGSLECAGEPVDLRLRAGTLDSVEDFGFIQTDQGPRLVCGEFDRDLLVESLVHPLQRSIAEHRVLQAAERTNLVIEHTTEVDGVRRIVLRRQG